MKMKLKLLRPVNIVFAHAIHVGNAHNHSFRASAGSYCYIWGHIDWPGKPRVVGIPERGVYTTWSFWDFNDIDGAFIFSGHDVAECIIPDQPYWRRYLADAPLAGAPFKVRWEA